MAPRPTAFFLMMAAGLVLAQEAMVGTKIADSTSAVGTSTPVIATTAEGVKSGTEATSGAPSAETVQDVPDHHLIGHQSIPTRVLQQNPQHKRSC
ncbi:hypothetical protein M8J77_021168 [Diaphorina citri]|nr:hypothetical protein M8J77_021168 [Diaphorina citri]